MNGPNSCGMFVDSYPGIVKRQTKEAVSPQEKDHHHRKTCLHTFHESPQISQKEQRSTKLLPTPLDLHVHLGASAMQGGEESSEGLRHCTTYLLHMIWQETCMPS